MFGNLPFHFHSFDNRVRSTRHADYAGKTPISPPFLRKHIVSNASNGEAEQGKAFPLGLVAKTQCPGLDVTIYPIAESEDTRLNRP